MRNQYYKKPKTFWDWVTGAREKLEQRRRTYGAKTTKSDLSSAPSESKKQQKEKGSTSKTIKKKKTESHSQTFKNKKKQNKASNSSEKENTKKKLAPDKSMKKKKTESHSQTFKNKNNQKKASNSSVTKDVKNKLVTNAKSKKPRNDDFPGSGTKAKNKSSSVEHPSTSNGSNSEKKFKLKKKKKKKQAKRSASSSIFTHIIEDNVNNEAEARSDGWCSCKNLCILLIIIGCCGGAFAGYQVYVKWYLTQVIVDPPKNIAEISKVVITLKNTSGVPSTTFESQPPLRSVVLKDSKNEKGFLAKPIAVIGMPLDPLELMIFYPTTEHYVLKKGLSKTGSECKIPASELKFKEHSAKINAELIGKYCPEIDAFKRINEIEIIKKKTN